MLAYPAIESWLYHRVDQRLDDAIKAVEDALEEPAIKESLTVAEPVAWKHPDKNIVFWKNTKEVDEYHGFKSTIPLYTAPPRREWVGLTDEEIYVEAEKEEQAHGFILGAMWAETKLREKNSG
jgi:hypothetical protein